MAQLFHPLGNELVLLSTRAISIKLTTLITAIDITDPLMRKVLASRASHVDLLSWQLRICYAVLKLIRHSLSPILLIDSLSDVALESRLRFQPRTSLE